MLQSSVITLIFTLLFNNIHMQSLGDIKIKTDDFFKNLSEKYEIKELTKETKLMIDQKVDEYSRSILQELKASRSKKELLKLTNQEAGKEIFSTFEEILDLNLLDVRDLKFFKYYNGIENWFAAVLTSSHLMIYRLHDKAFEPEIEFKILDSSKILIMNYEDNIFIAAQRLHHLEVYHLFLYGGKFTIQNIQNIDLHDIKDVFFLRGRQELLLGVLTLSNINVYSLQPSEFQPIQILPCKTKYSSLFNVEESIILVASENRKTLILRYDQKKRSFFKIQTINRSTHDAGIVHMLSQEYFLVLSNNESTALYKYTDKKIFVPFQSIDPADRVVTVKQHNKALLMLLDNHILSVYQYDGWSFVKLNIHFNNVVVMSPVVFKGENHLLFKMEDESWRLNRINWEMRKLLDFKTLKQWCSTAKEKAKRIPNLEDRQDSSFNISRGSFRKLRVNKVNEMSIEKLNNLTELFDGLVLRLSKVNESLNGVNTLKNMRFSNLRAQTVRTNCTNKCSAKKLVTKMKCDDFSRLRKINNETQILNFEHVKVDKLDDLPCPVLGVQLQEVNVEGLTNGIDFDKFQKNVLRTSGDQIVTGKHAFEDLQADSVTAPTMEIASSYSRQFVRTDSIYAGELSLADGGLLLPLDGQPVTMSGTLTASRVSFDGPVQLRGHPSGRSISQIAPTIDFLDYQKLTGDYTLRNARVTSLLQAEDVTRREGSSLKHIVQRVVPLNGSVPVRLDLDSVSVQWTNLTLQKPINWLTRKNNKITKVVGTKIAPNTVTLPGRVYSALPMPKLQVNLCGAAMEAPNIKTATISVGQAKAKIVVSENVQGALELNDAFEDVVDSLDKADLSHKSFTGSVFIENVNISSFDHSPFFSFQKLKSKWYRPDHIEGSFRVKDLKVDSLTTPSSIKIPALGAIETMIVEGNLNVKKINGIDLEEFMKNVVRIDDVTSLNNITFANVEIDEIETEKTNINLQSFEENLHLGNKVISGDLIIENDLVIPNKLAHPSVNEINTYVIEGSVKFKEEPKIDRINGKNLLNLLSEVWMVDRPATITGNFFFENVTYLGELDIYDRLHTPNYGSWESLEGRLLSKTRDQDIQVPAHFRYANIPNVITRGSTALFSSDKYLQDFLDNTLKKNKDQIISEKWRLDELVITDNLTLYGKMNELNITKDVARHDVSVNIVNGRKVVQELRARNLNGSNFGDWVKDVLMSSNTDNSTIVRGKKTFELFNARVLSVNGTVMGKLLEDCLSKVGDQVITAPKIIKGSLYTPQLTVQGLFNGVNLTDLMDYKLKEEHPLQMIKSEMTFNGVLQILGNLTIDGNFEGFKLTELGWNNNTLISDATGAMTNLKPYALGVQNIMKHRAKYWYAFELVQEEISISVANLPSIVSSSFTFNGLGNCSLISPVEVICNQKKRFPLKSVMNSETILIYQNMILIEEIPFIVLVSSGPRSRIMIYVYNYKMNSFDLVANVRVLGITEVKVIDHEDTLWIVTRLQSQMLVVSYESKGGIMKHHMTGSKIFALDRVPMTNELVLVRDDGMWKLRSPAGPMHVFKDTLDAVKVETFSVENEFYVKLISDEYHTRLLKARYFGV